jgi:hypothetical protein
MKSESEIADVSYVKPLTCDLHYFKVELELKLTLGDGQKRWQKINEKLYLE